MNFNASFLPPINLQETTPVLKKLASAHRFLAELKGVAASIPNQIILINTLTLQEAKDSSAIENIITTQDELFKSQLFDNMVKNAAAKEVTNYAEALKRGFALVQQHKLITVNHILEIQQILERNTAGFRHLPGTALVNEKTGEVIYTPPQNHDDIVALMDNLVRYINDPSLHNVDPLVKMAVIHFQFETIHPFYDGNGRTGRIINILYLVLQNLLSLPVLYLSRHIIRTKGEYYRLLQYVRETNDWQEWLLYMLEAVEDTSRQTIRLIESIRDMMMDYKHRIRSLFPKMYSQDLINNLFRHPYTKIDFIAKDLNVSRLTAAKYLEILTENGFIDKAKIGASNFYINMPLFLLFAGENQSVEPTPPIITRNPLEI